MMGFSTEASHPNVVAGNKRPAHTLAPALVLRDRQPVLGIATPGAFAQTQSLCQLLNNVLVFGFELQQALEAPRWFDDVDNTTLIESRIPLEVVATLSSSGHKINVGGPWEPNTGNAQAVQIDDRPAGRIIYGAADLRRNGCALGW
jgi:gamma-glutamyltranspeptidase/glutathione hydrolase